MTFDDFKFSEAGIIENAQIENRGYATLFSSLSRLFPATGCGRSVRCPRRRELHQSRMDKQESHFLSSRYAMADDSPFESKPKQANSRDRNIARQWMENEYESKCHCHLFTSPGSGCRATSLLGMADWRLRQSVDLPLSEPDGCSAICRLDDRIDSDIGRVP